MTARWTPAALLLALGLMAGCSPGGPAETPAPPTPALTPEATPAPETTPAPEPAPTTQPEAAHRFAVVGDFGTGGRHQYEVAQAIRQRSVGMSALVTTGDNVYPDGSPARFDEVWHRPYGWVSQARLPVVASLGNHDVRTDDGVGVMELFGMPARYYERTIGPVRFVVLDANTPGDPAQLDFLRSALAAPRTASWTVAVFHQPAYSCGRHGSTPGVQSRWAPELARGGVDLVLQGHDHNYQRFAPIEGVAYLVTGGGGAGLYEMRTCPAATPAPAASAVAHHFVEVTATQAELSTRAVASDGRLLDEAVLADSIADEAA